MTADVWTIVDRELHEQARRPWTYGLRVVLALIAVGAFALAADHSAQHGVSEQFLGMVLFSYLQIALFAAIWLVVPFLICDTLSREKREGTLGLLFLTPLRPGSVVVGKSLAHGLRAVALLAVFVPLLGLPWLVGGVGWREYVGVCLTDVTSIGLALSAGLLASALTRQRNWAMVFAAALTVAAFSVYAWTYLKGYSIVVAGPYYPFRRSYVELWQSFLTLATGMGGAWQPGGRNVSNASLTMNAGFALLSGFSTVQVARIAAYLVRMSLQTEGGPRWMMAWQKTWTKPRVAKSQFKSKMRRALERNPVGWLQQRRTGARVTKWTWCLTVVVVEAAGLLVVHWNVLPWLHFWLGFFLAVGLSLSAAGSFQTERESGAFELLLATPLRERDIMWGRLRGLWDQFAPGFLLVLGAAFWWSYQGGRFKTGYWGRGGTTPELFYHLLPWLTAVSWLAIPAIGLRASLVSRTFAQAWMTTVAWGFFLPGCAFFLLPALFRWMPQVPREEGVMVRLLAVVMVAQVIAGVGHLILLQRRMVRREFQTAPA